MTMIRPGSFQRNARRTHAILEALLQGVDQATGTSLRDGADGWNCVEVVCHLRDFELIWQERVRLMLAQSNPLLPVFDHEGDAIRKNYAAQNLAAVWAERTRLRRESVALMDGLAEMQWNCRGVHPEAGQVDVLQLGMQMCLHDVDHAEQIARILGKTAGWQE